MPKSAAINTKKNQKTGLERQTASAVEDGAYLLASETRKPS